MSWFAKLFPDATPSFDELRAGFHADAAKLSKEEARRRFVEHPFWSPVAAAPFRDRILALVDGPTDAGTHERCAAVVQEAIAATGFLVRPGTVEDLWYLDGLVARLLTE